MTDQDKAIVQMRAALEQIRDNAATMPNGGAWAGGIAQLCLGTLPGATGGLGNVDPEGTIPLKRDVHRIPNSVHVHYTFNADEPIPPNDLGDYKPTRNPDDFVQLPTRHQVWKDGKWVEACEYLCDVPRDRCEYPVCTHGIVNASRDANS